jgi:hypothetical protein
LTWAVILSVDGVELTTDFDQTESPYSAGARSKHPSLQNKVRVEHYHVTDSLSAFPQFSLSPDIRQWGFDLSPGVPEPDDDLHTPDARSPGFGVRAFSGRGLLNFGCLILLCLSIVALL